MRGEGFREIALDGKCPPGAVRVDAIGVGGFSDAVELGVGDLAVLVADGGVGG